MFRCVNYKIAIVIKNIGSYRVEIADILNELFLEDGDKAVFSPCDIKKRSGGVNKKTKYELSISIGWSAHAEKYHKIVHCVGLNMKDFLEEYRRGNVVYLEEDYIVSLYKDDPIWRTRGYVAEINKKDNMLILNIDDIFDPVAVKIQKEMPKWLYGKDDEIYFTCKIYHFWAMKHAGAIGKCDWGKVWKTFRRSHLSQWDIEDKYYGNQIIDRNE
jgi:hypothetical protein